MSKISKPKLIKEMTRDEVKEAIEEFPVAILPLGATEQHGHHLPLGLDTFLAENLANEVSRHTGSLVIPALPFGYSWVWRDIPGTISIQQHHLENIIKDVAHSVKRYGVEMLVLISGHESNNSSMKYAVRELADEIQMPVIYLFYPGYEEVVNEYCESPLWYGMIHADEFETSLMLDIRPDLVSMEKAVTEYPEKPLLYGKSIMSLGDMSKSGVFGDAKKASKEKGKKLKKIFTEKIVNIVNVAYKDLVIDKD